MKKQPTKIKSFGIHSGIARSPQDVSCSEKEIKEIAEKRIILVIEDAAEAFGAETGNRKIGSFGDSAISFTARTGKSDYIFKEAI
jgi:hypothetical protein